MSLNKTAISLSRMLRRNQTTAERVFWKKVRNKQFHGLKIRRQHPVFYTLLGKTRFFIADFYCADLNLIIEIDGGIHEKQKYYDTLRSEILATQKQIKIIRFTNDDILKNIDLVLMRLENFIRANLK